MSFQSVIVRDSFSGSSVVLSDLNLQINEDPFLRCAKECNVEGLRKNLASGAKIDVRSEKGWNVLHSICNFMQNNSADVVFDSRYFIGHLSAKAFTESLNAILSHAEISKIINLPDNEGNTPYSFAARNPHIGGKTLKLLVKAGAIPDASNKQGKNPLQVSLESSNFALSTVESFNTSKAASIINSTYQYWNSHAESVFSLINTGSIFPKEITRIFISYLGIGADKVSQLVNPPRLNNPYRILHPLQIIFQENRPDQTTLLNLFCSVGADIFTPVVNITTHNFNSTLPNGNISVFKRTQVTFLEHLKSQPIQSEVSEILERSSNPAGIREFPDQLIAEIEADENLEEMEQLVKELLPGSIGTTQTIPAPTPESCCTIS